MPRAWVPELLFVICTVAVPWTFPRSVYVPVGTGFGCCTGVLGSYGWPHVLSETGAGVTGALGLRSGKRAIINRLLRPPGSVESAQRCGAGLAPQARFSV